MAIVQVAFDIPLDRLFDYVAPAATEADIGRRVLAPLGSEEKVGVILGVGSRSDLPLGQLKPLACLWRDVPPFTADDLKFLRFCSEYYHHPLGSVVLNALPPGLRKTSGWVPMRRPRKPLIPEQEPEPSLTPEQSSVVGAVMAGMGDYHPFLLHGVTGSGKTEVYLHLIRHVVSQGRQVLVLTPEINLTPQLELRFRQRLPGLSLISMHSDLGEKERATRWLMAQSGEAQMVLGTRSTLFCPMPSLGLVIVDEEHDPSYKQQEGLRYSARDLAVVRAQNRRIPVVLGSATPSLESWWNARNGRYRLLALTHRAVSGARLPAMRLVKPPPGKTGQSLAAPVLQALSRNLENREQSLVFINRRGFAPVLVCSQCNWVSGCSRCSARMVVHLRAGQLRCHHCGEQHPIPSHCPDCGNSRLDTIGAGTQKVESQLRGHFPEARIVRLDSDSLSKRGTWVEMLSLIESGQVDILVGTQLLVKGHDFPNLTLVTALNVDGALYSNDFRSAERVFSQLIQVAGRAGRATRPGEVMIQTEFPQHALFKSLLAQDYPGFAERELQERRLTGFPPFAFQAILRATSEKPALVERFMQDAADWARKFSGTVEVYDPVPALMSRVAGKTRFQLLVQSLQRRELQSFLSAWRAFLLTAAPSRMQWILDVDPVEL